MGFVEEVFPEVPRNLARLIDQFTPPSTWTPPNTQLSTNSSFLLPPTYTSTETRKRRRLNPEKSSMIGFYGKRFRVGKRKAPNPFRIRGYERYQELGGIATDAGTGGTATLGGVCYIGHGTAFHNYSLALYGAIVRRVFMNIKHEFASWTEKIQGNQDNDFSGFNENNFTVIYKAGNSLENTEVNTQIIANMTYDELAIAVHAAMQSVYPNAANFQLVEAYLVGQGGAGVSVAPRGRVNLRNASVRWKFSSVIQIQNRTNAGGSDSVEVNDVNPLHGKVYEGYGNCFRYGFTSRDPPPATYPPSDMAMTAGFSTGVVTWNNLQGSNNMDAVYRRPPSNRNAFIGCKRIGNCRLQPGQIRKGVITHDKTLSMKNAIALLAAAYEGGTTTAHSFPLGKIQLYGFEKYVRTSSGESDIALGYEINQRYACIVITHPTETLAVQSILTA